MTIEQRVFTRQGLRNLPILLFLTFISPQILLIVYLMATWSLTAEEATLGVLSITPVGPTATPGGGS